MDARYVRRLYQQKKPKLIPTMNPFNKIKTDLQINTAQLIMIVGFIIGLIITILFC